MTNIYAKRHGFEQDDTTYRLTVEDFQTVADDMLERDLTDAEIAAIRDKLEIDWYDAVENAMLRLNLQPAD